MGCLCQSLCGLEPVQRPGGSLDTELGAVSWNLASMAVNAYGRGGRDQRTDTVPAHQGVQQTPTDKGGFGPAKPVRIQVFGQQQQQQQQQQSQPQQTPDRQQQQKGGWQPADGKGWLPPNQSPNSPTYPRSPSPNEGIRRGWEEGRFAAGPPWADFSYGQYVGRYAQVPGKRFVEETPGQLPSNNLYFGTTRGSPYQMHNPCGGPGGGPPGGPDGGGNGPPGGPPGFPGGWQPPGKGPPGGGPPGGGPPGGAG